MNNRTRSRLHYWMQFKKLDLDDNATNARDNDESMLVLTMF